jgi:hypothetical protein
MATGILRRRYRLAAAAAFQVIVGQPLQRISIGGG